MQKTGSIPNTITLQGIPIQLLVHPQPGVRSWCPITSENNSSFSLKLLLAGPSSHTNHERKIQPLLQLGKIQAHVILSRGSPKYRAEDEARLRGKASSSVQPRQGHSSKGGCSKSDQKAHQVPLVKARACKALKTVTCLDVLVEGTWLILDGWIEEFEAQNQFQSSATEFQEAFRKWEVLYILLLGIRNIKWTTQA